MAEGVVVNKNSDKKPVCTDNKAGVPLEFVMDKLRSRRQQQPTWILLHTSLSSDKKLANLDCLRKQVVILQQNVKVSSLMYLVEKLEAVSNQVGLKFSTVDQSMTDVCISSNMFFVRLILLPSGTVKDVHISHGFDQRPCPCPELLDSLRMGKFDDLKRHLDGLIALYDVDGDKKQKQLVYRCLQALEADLTTLSTCRQSSLVNVASYLHKTPLGLLSPRAGGLPMKLTYFVGPYDLLNAKTHKMTPMTIEAIIENEIGYSLTVGIEKSTPHRLQTVPVVNNKTGTSTNNGSYALLPALFSLHLHRPLALSVGVIELLRKIPGVELVETNAVRPLAALLVEQMFNAVVKDVDAWEKYSFVPLSQSMCHRFYLITSDSTQQANCLHASIVNKILFSQPQCVPPIVNLLRQQALFNTVLSSCLRPLQTITNDKTNSEVKVKSFDIMPLSLQQMSVVFEHPYRQSLTTVEVDLCDITDVRCRLTNASNSYFMCTDEYATKVLQRSLSLPIMLRAILQKAAIELAKQPIRPVTPDIVPIANRRMSSLSNCRNDMSLNTAQRSAAAAAVSSTVTGSSQFPMTTQVAATSGHSSHSANNPMLVSLLEPANSPVLDLPILGSGPGAATAAVASGIGVVVVEKRGIKRMGSVEVLNAMPQKRRQSNDEIFGQFPSPASSAVGRPPLMPAIKPLNMPRSAALQSVSRSYSVPSTPSVGGAGGIQNRPMIKLEPPANLSQVLSPQSPYAKPFPSGLVGTQLQQQQQLVKDEMDVKPLSKAHAAAVAAAKSASSSSCNSELINLLSSDEFGPHSNSESAVGGGSQERPRSASATGIYEGNTSLFRAPSRTPGVTGSGGGGGVNMSSPASGPGGNVMGLGSSRSSSTEAWEMTSNAERVFSWDSSALVSSPNDEVGQRSLTPKANHVGNNSLSGGSSSNAVVKSKSSTSVDDLMKTSAAAASMLSSSNKPPITVKLRRQFVKPSKRGGRGTPQSDSALDRAAWKEKIKRDFKIRPRACDSSPGESIDTEVDCLTSSGFRGVSPVSPAVCSSSPQLAGAGSFMSISEQVKVAEKRPRVMGKLTGAPTEKKLKKDDHKKVSRKMSEYEFDDGDVFIGPSTASVASPMEKVTTIKITKSDGRLQVQNSARASSSVSGSSGHRPLLTMPKSASVSAGNARNLPGTKFSRPNSASVKPGFPTKTSKIVSQSPISKPKLNSDLTNATVSMSGTSKTSTSGLSKSITASNNSTSGSGGNSSKTTSAGKPATQGGGVKKESLSAVIDKLRKNVPSGGAELYDQIRLEIIREGTKSSTPTRDLSSSSVKTPTIPKPPPIPVRKLPQTPATAAAAAVTMTPAAAAAASSSSSTAPLTSAVSTPSADSQQKPVKFTAPPASPPIAASRDNNKCPDNVSVVLPRISRDQLHPPLSSSQSQFQSQQSVERSSSSSPVIPPLLPTTTTTISTSVQQQQQQQQQLPQRTPLLSSVRPFEHPPPTHAGLDVNGSNSAVAAFRLMNPSPQRLHRPPAPPPVSFANLPTPLNPSPTFDSPRPRLPLESMPSARNSTEQFAAANRMSERSSPVTVVDVVRGPVLDRSTTVPAAATTTTLAATATTTSSGSSGEDSNDRLATRHFTDAMTHGTVSGGNTSTAANSNSTAAVIDSAAAMTAAAVGPQHQVERLLSPPRSPSPTPVVSQTVPVVSGDSVAVATTNASAATSSVAAVVDSNESLSSPRWSPKTSVFNLSAESNPEASKFPSLSSSSSSSSSATKSRPTLEATIRRLSSVREQQPVAADQTGSSETERKTPPAEIGLGGGGCGSSSSVVSTSPTTKSTLTTAAFPDLKQQQQQQQQSSSSSSSSSMSATRSRTPHSNASSPGASLIIDCFPGSPVIPMPQAGLPLSSPSATAGVVLETSSSHLSPSDVIEIDSEHPSPVVGNNQESSSPVASDGGAAHSGANDIDDDLMNEALML